MSSPDIPDFAGLPKLRPGDRVAVLSPSFGAPARWPAVYELGLERLRTEFGLLPVEFPTTRRLGASRGERARDLTTAFSDPSIRAVFASLGGDDQVTYVQSLPRAVFMDNPKPFFGFSDNTHFVNHLWQCGVPSFYGGHVLSQLAMHGAIDDFTRRYLATALFDQGETELAPSAEFNDVGLDWSRTDLLHQRRSYEMNDGWYWDGEGSADGISWGGCLESIDELLRHGHPLPSKRSFEQIVFLFETSEEMPTPSAVRRVLRALGERDLLTRVRAVLVGRPKAWEFGHERGASARRAYRADQRRAVVDEVRRYNLVAPVVQNLDFGHTDPQICIPMGQQIRVDSQTRRIWATF